MKLKLKRLSVFSAIAATLFFLNYSEINGDAAVNLKLFSEAHADPACLPMIIIPSSGGFTPRIILPPHCPLPGK